MQVQAGKCTTGATAVTTTTTIMGRQQAKGHRKNFVLPCWDRRTGFARRLLRLTYTRPPIGWRSGLCGVRARHLIEASAKLDRLFLPSPSCQISFLPSNLSSSPPPTPISVFTTLSIYSYHPSQAATTPSHHSQWVSKPVCVPDSHGRHRKFLLAAPSHCNSLSSRTGKGQCSGASENVYLSGHFFSVTQGNNLRNASALRQRQWRCQSSELRQYTSPNPLLTEFSRRC